jgi:ABC-type multidrug transport system ATPase subunit
MIRVERLTKEYGSFRALNDVSFEVLEGEVFALLGPNGSGKTTALKTMVGLNIPTSGRVLINGIDVHRHPVEVKRSISYLPQRVVFPENLTARELIRFYATLRNKGEDTADEAICSAKLGAFSDTQVGKFSGGMIQRLGLAVVALPDAPILLLDEPTANLDPHGVKRFREFILEQKEQRKTIIFSTHLLPEADQLADRVGIFVGGRIVAEESVENLRRAFLNHGGSLEDLYLHYVGDRHEEQ